MKNTVITTAELTYIINGDDAPLFTEKAERESLLNRTGADDVVVTKVQVFEGSDEE